MMEQLHLFDDKNSHADVVDARIEALRVARENSAMIKAKMESEDKNYSKYMQFYRGCLLLEWQISRGIPEDRRP